MLYSETELKKRLKSGCPVFYFYASDEALVRSAAAKAEKFLSEEAPDTTTLDGPTPSVEDIVLAAGTISFFGGRRLVILPLIRPSAYSDKDLQELCDTLSDTERAALQEMARTWAGEYHTTFAPGAEAALLDRCGDDQFLLQNEIAKLAALSGYTTITTQMIQQLGTVTLDADTFDMVKLVAAGNTRQALAKLQTLLELQNEPILITGALIGNYLDIYRAFLAKKSRRPLADLAKDFKYTGKWNYRLGNADQTAARFQRSQIEESLRILQKLDLDLKGSRLNAPLLMQKAICELSLARSRA